MARKKTMKQMGDDMFDPAKTLGEAVTNVARIPGNVVDFLGKNLYVAGAEVGSVLEGNYYKSRKKIAGLNKLIGSGASLETMDKWYTGKYNKRNKGGR
jgi:hypothetical protein